MRLLFLSILCLTSIWLNAQTTLITGIVTDESNKAVSEAQIDVVGKTASTITDDDGKFALPLRKTAKGDIITIRVTKKNYMVASETETVSELLLKIRIKGLKGKSSSNPSISKPADTAGSVLNAPNAQIATMYQTGGANTVINNYDSFGRKEEALKSTSPQCWIGFYLDTNSSIIAQFQLLNDVPIRYRFYLARADNISIHHGSMSFGPPPVAHRNNGKIYSVQVENFLDSQFPHDKPFRVIVHFIYESIYYEEMNLPNLGGDSVFLFDIDLSKHRMTPVQQ